MSKLAELRACASAWEPQARLLGNVRADEIVALCDELEAARGLYMCSLGERKVLDAMAAIPLESFDWFDGISVSLTAAAQAELDRRAEEEP